MKVNRSTLVAALLVALGAYACDSAGPVEDESEPQSGSSSNIDIASTQGLLRAAGYLPDRDLAAAYPGWHPIVDEEPEPDVLDATTQKALRAFQHNHGLPETGALDSKTTTLLETPRCGVPDGIERPSESDKFRLQFGKRISRTDVRWKLNVNSSTPSWAANAIAIAFGIWQVETDVTFRQVSSSSTADITFSFGTTSKSSTIAETTNANPPRITFDRTRTWTMHGSFEPGKFDLVSIAAHEIGHALGLGHSTIGSARPNVAVMWPVNHGEIVRTLWEDDRVGVRALYDNFAQVGGLANDVGSSPTTATVWHIGTESYPEADGFKIYKLVNGGWVEATGRGGASRIAVLSNGRPVVVTRGGSIFWHEADHALGGWNHIPGCATDVGTGNDGSVWIVTCQRDFDSLGLPLGYRVAKLSGSTWTPDTSVSNAIRISVGPDGRPWIVTGNNVIRQRTSSDPQSGIWESIGGSSASDISVDRFGRPWIVSVSNATGGFSVLVRNVQPSGPVDGQDVPAMNEFVRVGGSRGGQNIAVGPRAVWISDSSRNIFKTND